MSDTTDDYIDLKNDPCRRAAAEAIMLRAQHAYRSAWHDAGEMFGADVSLDPQPQTFEALSERYVRLLDEYATERPRTAGGVHAYLELVAMIIAAQLTFDFECWEPSPVSPNRDFGYALQLLMSASHWLNERDIEEVTDRMRRRMGGAA